jgi:hypothetical protein
MKTDNYTTQNWHEININTLMYAGFRSLVTRVDSIIASNLSQKNYEYIL